MRRREFIALASAAAAAWPCAAWAQQPNVPLVGYLHTGSYEVFGKLIAAFHEGLNTTGYIEGENVAIDFRWAEGQYERLPVLAAELVNRRVAIIVTGGGEVAAVAARAATATIPIVFTIGSDPVRSGLVTSLSHPGGNLTGATVLNTVLVAKQLELLHELVPGAASVAILLNPDLRSAELIVREVREAGRVLGLEIHVLRATSEREIEEAFTTLARLHAGGLLLTGDALFHTRREQIVAFAARHAVPAIYFQREFAEIGGLISYATHYEEAYRQAGIYVGRILKGAKPADLPVLQPTKFELVINLKTAKALGLTVPPTLLAQADEVIE